jgi:hypothetical protein
MVRWSDGWMVRWPQKRNLTTRTKENAADHNRPTPSDPCFEVNLAELPPGPFVINDSYPESYAVTSPCGAIKGGCGSPMVQTATGVAGCAAGRPLGYFNQSTTVPMVSPSGW